MPNDFVVVDLLSLIMYVIISVVNLLIFVAQIYT